MLCVSISEPSVKKILNLIKKSEIVEVRLDLMDLSDQDIEKVFSGEGRIIATCRAGKFSDEQRKNKLKKAIESGASYVDIEIDAPDGFKRELVSAARKHNCKVILSYHNFTGTPPTDELSKMVDAKFRTGGGYCQDCVPCQQRIGCCENTFALCEAQEPRGIGHGRKRKDHTGGLIADGCSVFLCLDQYRPRKLHPDR